MRPTIAYHKWITFDLTACRLYFIDGRVVAHVPTKWEYHNNFETTDADGKAVTLKQYIVTEWKEVPLAEAT